MHPLLEAMYRMRDEATDCSGTAFLVAPDVWRELLQIGHDTFGPGDPTKAPQVTVGGIPVKCRADAPKGTCYLLDPEKLKEW